MLAGRLSSAAGISGRKWCGSNETIRYLVSFFTFLIFPSKNGKSNENPGKCWTIWELLHIDRNVHHTIHVSCTARIRVYVCICICVLYNVHVLVIFKYFNTDWYHGLPILPNVCNRISRSSSSSSSSNYNEYYYCIPSNRVLTNLKICDMCLCVYADWHWNYMPCDKANDFVFIILHTYRNVSYRMSVVYEPYFTCTNSLDQINWCTGGGNYIYTKNEAIFQCARIWWTSECINTKIEQYT